MIIILLGFMSPRLSSPSHPSSGAPNILSGGRSPMRGLGGGGGGAGGGAGRGGGVRNRDLIGQTIKITQGHYKGSIGIVKVSAFFLLATVGKEDFCCHGIFGC